LTVAVLGLESSVFFIFFILLLLMYF